MNFIDIGKLIKDKNLSKKEIAFQLFPDIKYPRLALNRVIKGEGLLNSDQISKLALLTGISIPDLFSQKDWKTEVNSKVYQFSSGEFIAKLDTETWITKVFHKKSLFHESVIHKKTISISEYIKELNLIITKYKNNE